MNQTNMISELRKVAQRTMPVGSQVLLYGSRARGDAREDSDWDLLLLIDKDKVDREESDRLIYPFTYLGWQYGAAVIPVVYTKKEWQEQYFMPFQQNVERDKIEIA